MNQTVHSAVEITSSSFADQRLDSNEQNDESLAIRILSGLVKYAKIFRNHGTPIVQHKSFIEENLLDKNMGPEISRTLRR